MANTGYHETGAPELTWALLLAIARHIIPENAALRIGGWQQHVGSDLSMLDKLGRHLAAIKDYNKAATGKMGL